MASFTVACTDLDCSVDASASSDADGTISTYAWDFGDGGTATGAMANYSYATGGTFTIGLTVTDDDNATGADSQDVTVTPPNMPPTAAFTGTCTNLDCDFDASTSTDADGTIADYAWDFGDGNTGTGATVSHSFAADGDYTVTLTITDDDGATDSADEMFTVTSPALIQLGDTIDGALMTDRDGRMVDISDDGTRVVLATPFGDAGRIDGGQVRIFELNGTTWTQIGQTLANPEPVQRPFGEVLGVSISGNGQRVAVGNQFGIQAGSSNRGSIYIYEFMGGAWQQIGATIDTPVNNNQPGIDGYGISVSLSADGSRLAAGASTSDATVNGVEGAFTVFEFAGGGWNIVGDSVYGSQPGERFGYDVDISDDGSRVVVGAPSYNEINMGGQNATPGRAFVYEFSGGAWTAVGDTIVGRLDGPADIRLGQSVKISGDGQRISTFGNFSGDEVRVFELSGNSWVQMGDVFTVTVAFDLHEPMSLSSDGSRIAIGRPFTGGNNNGTVEVFDWNGTTWESYAPAVLGDTQFDTLGYSIAMTPDGTRLVAGVPGWDGVMQTPSDDRGGARVYDIR